MYRYAEERLNSWISKKSRKPLMIRGARQVGKSTLVRLFAKKHNYSLIELNLERLPNLKEIFISMKPDLLFKEIEFGLGLGNVKSERTILFIDEIQVIPEAIQALRYLYEDYPEIPVITAGSLLEFALSDNSFSMPVGRIEYLWLNPMTFSEYIIARKKEHLLSYLDDYQIDESFSINAHENLITMLREYFFIGGMPESVLRYIETESLEESEETISAIAETYREDFSKYCKKNQLVPVQTVFEYLGRGAGNKIKYVNISREISSQNLSYALELLSMAQVITQTHRTDAELPLAAGKKIAGCKLFSLDIGILSYLSGIKALPINNLMNIKMSNQGALAEQFICQHLLAIQTGNKKPENYFWNREERGVNAEVDFVMNVKGQVIPVEVKSGKSGTLKSLHQFMYWKKSKFALRFDLNPPSIQDISVKLTIKGQVKCVNFKLLSLPLYMIEHSERFINDVFSEL